MIGRPVVVVADGVIPRPAGPGSGFGASHDTLANTAYSSDCSLLSSTQGLEVPGLVVSGLVRDLGHSLYARSKQPSPQRTPYFVETFGSCACRLRYEEA